MEKLVDESMVTEKFSLLMQLIGRINSNLEIDTLLLDIMKASKIIMDSEASTLMLLDKSTNELVLSIPTGPATAEVSGKRFPADQGIAGWVVTNKKAQIVNDTSNDSRFLGDFDRDKFITRNLICVPLVNNEGQVIGALQALNKKNDRNFDDDDLMIFQSLANQAAIAIETAELHEERMKMELLEQQMTMAQNIQSAFWPKINPAIDGYDISGTSRPATWVGGDYYDFIPIADTGKWGIVVADVSGKGMPASLLMATVRAALRTQIENNNSTKDTIERVNRCIYKDTPSDKFITLFYGELDPENHTFTYVNAGHNEPYLVNLENGKSSPLQAGGVMLGVMEDFSYDCEEVPIQPGEKIVIFSDGVTEAMNQEGELYGEEKLKKWLARHNGINASELIALLLRDIETYRGARSQSDDITIVSIIRDE